MSGDRPAPEMEEVPNPAYGRLEDLRADAVQQRDWYQNVLEPAVNAMVDGAWTGPSDASAFQTELEGRHGDLSGYFDRFIEDIDDEMAATDATTFQAVREPHGGI